jgi:hypothetical protein
MEVRGFAFFCAFSTLVIGSGGCLLFTDDFNKAPQVKIDGPPALFRGEARRFAAVVQDDDVASQLEWGVVEGGCPMTLADADTARRKGGSTGDQTTFDLPKITKAGPSCVYVIVTDRSRARNFAALKIDVKDRPLVIHKPSPIVRNQTADFSAAFLTDAGGSDDVAATQKGSFAWARDRVCADSEKAAMMGTTTKSSTWNLGPAPRRSFCVSVFALDENGISATTSVEIADTEIVNTGPSALIRMVAPAMAMPVATPLPPLGLFTMVKLSGADAGDVGPDDAGNFSWKLTRPRGVSSMSTGAELAFTTETAGHYQVELTITEDGKMATAAPLAFDVVDAPPCIAETEPSLASGSRFVGRYDQPRVFRVFSVTDDADPVPATMRTSQGTFVWATRLVPAEPGQSPAMIPFTPRAGSLPELVLPARLYQPGDRVEVRVDYLDRRDLVEGQRDLSHCKINEPRCGVMMMPPPADPKDVCYQRLTWTVDYLL